MTVKAKARKTLSRKSHREWKRDPRFWLAMGTLATHSVPGKSTALFAQAPEIPKQAAQTPGNAGTSSERRFDIPSGPLDTVLAAFRNAAGITIEASGLKLESISSPGVSGTYTDEQALRKLLQGTGLTYKFVGPATVTVHLNDVKSTVTVNAQAERLPSSPKYTEPLRNIPQSVDIVQQQTIKDQGATTLRDTLRNFAGISIAAGEGGAQGDNLSIRGFTARNDIFLDGMRDFGSYYRDPFNMEQVEVLQGPSSITFGRGSTGGVVNQETKNPGLDHFLTGSLQFGTDQTKRVTVDFNHPVHALGQNTAFRLNVMGDQGNVAGRDIAENRRFGVAPALAFGLGTRTRLFLNYFHQTGDDIPDYGLPWLFNGPAPVNRSNFYGFKDSDYLRTYDDVGTARLEHDFSPRFMLRNALRYANYVRDVRITEPQIVAPSLSTPLDQLQVNRHMIAVNSTETALDDQFDTTLRAKTGFLSHTLVTGAEAIHETSSPVRPNYTGVPTTSLVDPDPYQPFSGVATINTRVNTTANTIAGYVLDDVKIGRRWEFTGGFRFDRFASDYQQTVAPVSAFSRVDHLASWRAAVVYKPANNGSIYVSSGTSFNPSAETLALSASTANLPPEKNLTYETGTKWDFLSSRLSLRGALFETDKTNAREPDPNNPTLNVLAGDQRVRGLQFEATGRITDRWQLLTGYAYLHGKVVSSNYYPASVGVPLANVPKNTFSFWNTYKLPWYHIDTGAGGQFVDSRTASSTSAFDSATGLLKRLPSYWVFNAMVRCPLTERIDLQANVYNIANRYYYDQIHPAHIVPGPGRSALIGLNFKF